MTLLKGKMNSLIKKQKSIFYITSVMAVVCSLLPFYFTQQNNSPELLERRGFEIVQKINASDPSIIPSIIKQQRFSYSNLNYLLVPEGINQLERLNKLEIDTSKTIFSLIDEKWMKVSPKELEKSTAKQFCFHIKLDKSLVLASFTKLNHSHWWILLYPETKWYWPLFPYFLLLLILLGLGIYHVKFIQPVSSEIHKLHISSLAGQHDLTQFRFFKHFVISFKEILGQIKTKNRELEWAITTARQLSRPGLNSYKYFSLFQEVCELYDYSFSWSLNNPGKEYKQLSLLQPYQLKVFESENPISDIYYKITNSQDTSPIISESMFHWLISKSMLEEKSSLKNQLKVELQLGRKIQNSMLPQTNLISLNNMELQWNILSPTRPTGDLANMKTEDDWLHFYLADISRKDVSGALISASIHAFFLSCANEKPNVLVQKLNNHIQSLNLNDAFISILFARINTKTQVAEFSCAGFAGLMLIQGTDVSILKNTCIPLGIKPDTSPQLESFNLKDDFLICAFNMSLLQAINKTSPEKSKNELANLLASDYQNDTQKIIQHLNQKFNLEEYSINDELVTAFIKRSSN
jgi:hypothetical protein